MSRLRRRELHRLVQRKLRAWTRRLRGRGRAACVDVAGISLTKGGRTRMRDTHTSRSMRLFPLQSGEGGHHFQENSRHRAALECALKVLSDDLEEDEDLHNKLKSSDQITSDEQIAADNVKNKHFR